MTEATAGDSPLVPRGRQRRSASRRLRRQLILERSVVRDYNKGEAILRQGELARGLGAVLAGRIHV
jgi:CRP-like cAMP-binding protein